MHGIMCKQKFLMLKRCGRKAKSWFIIFMVKYCQLSSSANIKASPFLTYNTNRYFNKVQARVIVYIHTYVSSLIFFKATISLFSLFLALYTTPYVPSPTFSILSQSLMSILKTFGLLILLHGCKIYTQTYICNSAMGHSSEEASKTTQTTE